MFSQSEGNLVMIQPGPEVAKQVILVVDDDEAVLDALRSMMKSEGFEVRAFSNGLDLLNEASLPAIGCLVVDYRNEWTGSGQRAARSGSFDPGYSHHRTSNRICARPSRSNCGIGRRETVARKLSAGSRP
jgi:hypothetical protein